MQSSDRPYRRFSSKTLGKHDFSLEDTILAKAGGMPVARRATVGLPTGRFLGAVPSADLLTSPSGLIHDAVGAAMTSIHVIEEQLPMAADAVRWRGDGVAGPQLDNIIRHTKKLVLLAALASEVAGVNLRELRRQNRRVAETIDDTSEALDLLMACQDAGDSLGVADALTHQIARALSGWRIVFSAISAEVRRAA